MARLQEDVRRLRFWRSIVAEFIGSLFVVLIGCGAYSELTAAASDSGSSVEGTRKIAADDAATPASVGGGGWTAAELTLSAVAVKVSLAFGLTYAAVLYCVRNVGDAHLNPSVTVALLVTRRASFIRSLLYLVAQFLGGIVGAALLLAVTARQGRTGGCTRPADGVTEGQAFGVEFFATFLFVFVTVSCYDRTKNDVDRSGPAVAPLVVGLTYAGVTLFALPYTGGSINTARSFGPAIVNGIWAHHWVYWFGPIIGGVCGGAVYDVIFSTKSSFKRITACFTVFHRRDDEPDGSGGSAAASLRDSKDVEQGQVEKTELEGGDELEEDQLGETKTTDASGSGEQKPRHLKLFRPKFSCCNKDNQ